MSTLGDQIAAEALEWIGTPFRWQGRVKGVGVDCKGLVAGVARACGRSEGDSVEALAGDYSQVVDERRLRAGLRNLFDQASAIEPGDVILLRIGRKDQHLAIALSSADMVHCYGMGPHARVMRAAIPAVKLAGIWRWREESPAPGIHPTGDMSPAGTISPVGCLSAEHSEGGTA